MGFNYLQTDDRDDYLEQFGRKRRKINYAVIAKCPNHVPRAPREPNGRICATCGERAEKKPKRFGKE